MKWLVPLSLSLCFLGSFEAKAWGFWAHKKINNIAVYTLPEGMFGFYKKHQDYLTEHAVDPDKRRYAVEGEAPRHYIDIDHYGSYPFENVPRRWDSAVAKLSNDTLQAYGILPWHCNLMVHRLSKAFEEKDAVKILKLSAELGHYIGDAHVPLHTTLNYNGQLTNQHGIHGFWESRIPELFGGDYDYFLGKARYVEHTGSFIWDVVLESHLRVDSVLRLEREVRSELAEDQVYTFEQRGNSTVRTYSQLFSKLYSAAMNGMVEARLRKSIISVGSLWMTAWANAGQPNLSELEKPDPKRLEALEEWEKVKGKKFPSREHEH